ncbi:MAG: metal ABC transporter ATP-binding protein [Planctomycetota bacterium]
MHEGRDHAGPPTSGDDAVVVRGVSKSFGDINALEGITLGVTTGERLGVLGPNGGGKTTLIRLIQGDLRPEQGEVEVLGRTPIEARRAGLVGVVGQKNSVETSYPATARDLIGMPLLLRRSAADCREQIESAVRLVDASDFADRPVRGLSGGQLQRALIARAIASGAELLLLDEPTVGVDAPGQRLFNDLLDQLQSMTGVTIILVSHQLRTIAATCDRIACLNRTLHLHGDPSGLTPEVLREVFEHDVADLFVAGSPGGGADAGSEAPS